MTAAATAELANTTRFHAEAFGMGWASEVPMPGFQPAPPHGWPAQGRPVVEVRLVAAPPARSLHQAINKGHLCADGVRLACRDEAVFDMIDGQRILCQPGAAWSGALPVGFYGTLAALTACWRGGIALHASAVAWRGKAILLMGPGGSGKSTTTAAMLLAGAEFVGDDLSVLPPRTDPAGEHVSAGRPTLRLHPDIARLIATSVPLEPPRDATGKWQVRPAARITTDSLPLGAMLMLAPCPAGPIAPTTAATLLPCHLFRPRWQSALPGHGEALIRLLRLANHVPLAAAAPLPGFDPATLARHGQRLLEQIDRLPE